MTKDIQHFIAQHWLDEAALVLDLLKEWENAEKEPPDDRLIRCALFLSRGNLDTLVHCIVLGQKDARDLIWQAEYACGEDRRYDFSLSFAENGLRA